MKLEYKTITVQDGVSISYVDVGTGRPLVCTIGFGETVSTSAALIQRLSENYRVISFDHSGFGDSSPSLDVGVERSARDLHFILETLGLDDVGLIGYSMGGSLAFAYWEQFEGDRLSQIALVDTTPKLINEGDWNLGLWQGRYNRDDYEKDLQMIQDDPVQFHMSFYLRAATPAYGTAPEFPEYEAGEQQRDAWLAKIAEHTGIRDRLLRRVFCIEYNELQRALEQKYWRSMTGGNHLDVVSKVDLPTLALYAEPGSYYSPATGRWLAETMPRCELRTISDATHVFPRDRYAEYATILEEFFTR